MNKLLLALGLCFLGSQSALAGSGAHGADIEADQNNIWFLGREQIEYCLKVETTNPGDADELRTLIIESFADWRFFFASAGYLEKDFGNPGYLPSPFNVQFIDKIPRPMSVTGKEVPTCTNRDHQVEFRLSKDSESHWSLDTNHAFGAAIRGPYDHKTYRTGGIIWISTALQSRAERKHVLMHELGHMFGMPHNSTYVMYEKIGRLILLARSNTSSSGVLGVIESPSWRYLLWPGNVLEFTNMEVSGGNSQMSASSATTPFLGASPNAILPFVASSTQLTYLGVQANDVYQFTINLGFGAETTRMTGTFHRRFHQFDVGPSIHTKWLKDGKTMEGRIHLEMFRAMKKMEIGGGSKQIPLEGTFTDKKGVIYPAVLEFPFGAVVKLFDPKTGAWFTLSSYPYESAP